LAISREFAVLASRCQRAASGGTPGMTRWAWQAVELAEWSCRGVGGSDPRLWLSCRLGASFASMMLRSSLGLC